MFSLRTLFVGVAYAALVCAALVYRTPVLVTIVLNVTLVTGVGVVIAAWRFPTVRGFYGPTAVVLWLYVLVVFYQPLEKLERILFTNELIFQSWTWIKPESDFVADEWRAGFYTFEPRLRQGSLYDISSSTYTMYKELIRYYQIVHCVSALLLGLLAGSLTVWCERRRGDQKPITAG